LFSGFPHYLPPTPSLPTKDDKQPPNYLHLAQKAINCVQPCAKQQGFITKFDWLDFDILMLNKRQYRNCSKLKSMSMVDMLGVC
jgi:hypothetical protein